MKSIIIGACFALLLGASLQAQTVQYWRQHSTELPQFWDPGTHPISVPSSDGKLVLRVTGKGTGEHYPAAEEVPDYYIVSGGKRLSPSLRVYAAPSALWSPSSDLLAIQSTDGGAVGNWKLYVYSIADNRVVEHNVMQEVRRDLASRFPAGIRSRDLSRDDRRKLAQDTSWVNVLACAWLTTPERLVVTAEVPDSSSYGDNMGKALTYVIDASSGRILRRYTEEQSKQSWPQCVQ